MIHLFGVIMYFAYVMDYIFKFELKFDNLDLNFSLNLLLFRFNLNSLIILYIIITKIASKTRNTICINIIIKLYVCIICIYFEYTNNILLYDKMILN